MTVEHLKHYLTLFLQELKNGSGEQALSFLKACRKADLKNASIDGVPVLNFAIGQRQEEIVRTLLQYKVDPNIQMQSGEAALHVAARYGYSEFFEPLLRAGSLIELKSNKEKLTPLGVALEVVLSGNNRFNNDKINVVRSLLHIGARWKVSTSQLDKFRDKMEVDSPLRYLTDPLISEMDNYVGDLYKSQIRIRNVHVSGLRKAGNRPLNFLIFAIRNDFEHIVDYMVENRLSPIPDYFKQVFGQQNRYSTFQVLQKTEQLDKLINADFWQNNHLLMESFRITFDDGLNKGFWDKFAVLQNDAYCKFLQQRPPAKRFKRRDWQSKGFR